ncbi:hypothetical protein NliqN6_0213 [Naganishia liquefaciens]|uniref:N-acetyltransferase domain-containing protein n=1 Tax=Naganishia liquefaciens TaxID=104408 RepID=A0A8H3TN75_9TREE|nr:hypothetical protein NliqN6_0213 [Naganishia liquefaciens]
MNVPRTEWQKKLLEEYGEYTWLTEFAIAPAHQSQSLGRVLLRHVIALVEKDRLDLALTAVAHKVGFYSACGLEPVGEPLMYGPNKSLTGVVKMRWQYSTSRF